MYDRLPALIFAALVALVYVLATRYLIIGWIARRAGRNLSLGPREKYVRRIVWFLAVIGIGCIAYGYFVEPYWPEIVRVNLRTSKFKGTGAPVRVVHISD